MKKRINEMFDEAKPNELDRFADALEAPALSSEALSSIKEKFYAKTGMPPQKQKRTVVPAKWLAATAACFCLILSAILVAPMLRGNTPGSVPNPGTTEHSSPGIPIGSIQAPSSAPLYFGSAESEGTSDAGMAEINPWGLSVTAQLVETLPDTYTFFDDWRQQEFRLLRMETVTLLKGQEMTEGFYYMIPVDFMTDFSVFDKFVILDMAQFGYEYSVMYNKTQGKAEQLDLVLFGYENCGYHFMGEKFMAFDADGHFDERLWKSTEAWIAYTERSQAVDTITQAEQNARQDEWGDELYVHLLKDITGEAADVLSQVMSFENGVFVPTFSGMKLFLSPEVQLQAVRYINGFATNEKVSIWSKDWTGGDEDTFAITKARFNEEDMNALPDLASAIASVSAAYDQGEITPPHIVNYGELELSTYGIFGWYAKTSEGVIGVVRVTWRYMSGELDDAYYTVNYGSDVCTPTDRDDLLETIGEYETAYIYLGQYHEAGKNRVLMPCD